jgi:DNA-binding NarL/FixJ family response regulator
MEIILADPQGITRMGLMYLLLEMGQQDPRYVEDKAGLIERMKEQPAEIVVLDYNLFDFNDASEMFILGQRFPKTEWLLFSEELSGDFMRSVMLSGPQFSIIMKDSPLSEIREALRFVMHGKRFICQHATELLIEGQAQDSVPNQVNLTKTEQEILKDIALGMTTKEIAAKRFSSFHTVNTHRKNIFRKLGVNNVHEATKYALRAGLVDAAEYYI